MTRRRPLTDLDVIRALNHNESLRTPEPRELDHSEVLALFEEPAHAEDYFDHVAALKRQGVKQSGEPCEIEVTYDAQAAFWGADDSKWNATFGGYDLGCLIGQGRTPLDAIVDLLDQSEAVQS